MRRLWPLKTVMRKRTRAVCNRREKVINKITRPGNRIFLFLPTNHRNFLVEIYIYTHYIYIIWITVVVAYVLYALSVRTQTSKA